MIRFAKFSEHPEILKISKLSPYTRDFSNHIFSGEALYAKNWIAVSLNEKTILGFYCVRHKIRTPKTTLYFIGVAPTAKGMDIGSQLLEHMKANSPHKCIELNCAKDNAEGLRFYERHNFQVTGESLGGKGLHLELSW